MWLGITRATGNKSDVPAGDLGLTPELIQGHYALLTPVTSCSVPYRSLNQGSQSTAGEGEVAQSCPTLCDPMDCSPTRLLHPWDSPGKNTGVGYHFLLQGIFPKPGIKPGSPALEADALTSEPQGKPYSFIDNSIF